MRKKTFQQFKKIVLNKKNYALENASLILCNFFNKMRKNTGMSSAAKFLQYLFSFYSRSQISEV